MNRTAKFVIPALAAVFALVFIVTVPHVVAEMGEYKHDHMTEKINAYCDMSPEEQAEVIAKHNKSDEMVSKINEYCSLDEEGRQALIAEYKGKYKNHMKHKFADLTVEEREAKHAQFKEMKQAFSTISEEDRQTIMTHFKDMKGQYADLTEEERQAKHTEFKQQMEAFMGLTLDEKVSYLKYMAMSFRNTA